MIRYIFTLFFFIFGLAVIAISDGEIQPFVIGIIISVIFGIKYIIISTLDI